MVRYAETFRISHQIRMIAGKIPPTNRETAPNPIQRVDCSPEFRVKALRCNGAITQEVIAALAKS
jgi:hypothetical protein